MSGINWLACLANEVKQIWPNILMGRFFRINGRIHILRQTLFTRINEVHINARSLSTSPVTSEKYQLSSVAIAHENVLWYKYNWYELFLGYTSNFELMTALVDYFLE